MSILDLNAFVTLLLAISLAGERLVTALKNVYPEFFAFEAKNESKEIDLPADRNRRVSVQFLGFVFCWLAASIVASDDKMPFYGAMLGSFPLGSGASTHHLPTALVGLLASSGSALWSSVLGYTSAAKDARRQSVASAGLDFESKAERAGKKPPVDAGMAGRDQDDPAAAGSTFTWGRQPHMNLDADELARPSLPLQQPTIDDR